MENENGWAEYKRLVLFQLDGLDGHISKLEDKIDALTKEVTMLKVKISVISAGVALAATLITQIIIRLF